MKIKNHVTNSACGRHAELAHLPYCSNVARKVNVTKPRPTVDRLVWKLTGVAPPTDGSSEGSGVSTSCMLSTKWALLTDVFHVH